MPGKGKTSRKGAAKTRKQARKPKASTMPGFEPFVNTSAGLAATGLRIGFPANRTVSLNYAEYVSVTSAYGAQGLYQFRMNSAFDPNYTQAGHQPLGYDQWSAYYNHYVVEECAYEVTAVPLTGAHLVLITSLSDDATVPSVPYELVELGGVAALWAYDTPPHIFKGKVNVAKFFNRSNIATDSELRASVSANPADQLFLSVSAFSADATVASTTINLLVKLTLRVRFMEPKDLAPSKASGKDDEYEFVRVKKVAFSG